MHGLAVVAERFLRKPLGVAGGPGALSPRVPIAVKRDARDAELTATLAELRGPVPGTHAREIGKEQAFRRQILEDIKETLNKAKFSSFSVC